jgi:predicted tellurium resistance membrane protein TerC
MRSVVFYIVEEGIGSNGVHDGEWFGRLVEVLIVNLILSGDSAVVIAMAARTLEDALRR